MPCDVAKESLDQSGYSVPFTNGLRVKAILRLLGSSVYSASQLWQHSDLRIMRANVTYIHKHAAAAVGRLPRLA